ncbi:MAG: hypothetical protein NWF03_07635 [Candidatus Bathyarchaeota archaeon]|nr:hypothetical protein [Candidatus Bathyarchaeota archaeon]
MGTQIKCKECNYVMFEFNKVPTDIVWYSKLRQKIGAKCPNCGHKLPRVSSFAKKMRLEVISAVPVNAK